MVEKTFFFVMLLHYQKNSGVLNSLNNSAELGYCFALQNRRPSPNKPQSECMIKGLGRGRWRARGGGGVRATTANKDTVLCLIYGLLGRTLHAGRHGVRPFAGSVNQIIDLCHFYHFLKLEKDMFRSTYFFFILPVK